MNRNMKARKPNYVGGALIGKGQSGCVYKPPLKCLDRPDLDQKYLNGVMKWNWIICLII